MGRISINKNDDWHVEHDRQDIRGWVVHDAEGNTVGRVRDLVAETDSGLVETVVLDTGEEYPASTVDVGYGDKVVHLASKHAASHVNDREGDAPEAYHETRIRGRQPGTAKGFARHEPSFRTHFHGTYGESGREYGDYHSAYRLGYDYGSDDRFNKREWDGVEDEIRKDYEAHNREGTWDRVKDAAHHAFEKARSSSSSATPSK